MLTFFKLMGSLLLINNYSVNLCANTQCGCLRPILIYTFENGLILRLNKIFKILQILFSLFLKNTGHKESDYLHETLELKFLL